VTSALFFRDRARAARSTGALVGVCIACGGPREANAPGPSFVVDEPKQCLDPWLPHGRTWELQGPEWTGELERLIDRALQQAACIQATPAPGSATFALDFDRYGNAVKTAITASTLGECSAVQCLKSALARVMAPPLRLGETARYAPTIVLTPGAAPRRAAPDERVAASNANSHCADASLAQREQPAPPLANSEAIDAVVAAEFPKLRACYDRARVVDPDLTGTVTTTFVIGADGHVSSAHVTNNTLPNCEVVWCVRDTFLKFEFPDPTNRAAMAVYPIYFTPLRDSFETLDPSQERGHLAPGVLSPSW
jgi:hypothetical protein